MLHSKAVNEGIIKPQHIKERKKSCIYDFGRCYYTKLPVVIPQWF